MIFTEDGTFESFAAIGLQYTLCCYTNDWTQFSHTVVAYACAYLLSLSGRYKSLAAFVVAFAYSCVCESQT